MNGSWEPGKTATVKFTRRHAPGSSPFYCTEFCSALHLEMQGYVLVKPKGYKAKVGELMPKEVYTKADYDKQVAVNIATQGTIDGVVSYITGRDYKAFADGRGAIRGRRGAARLRRRDEDEGGGGGRGGQLSQRHAVGRPVVAVPGQGRGPRAPRQDQPGAGRRRTGQVGESRHEDLKMKWIVALSAGALALVFLSALPSGAEPAATGEEPAEEKAALDGATLYQTRTCIACHGPDAKTPILPVYPKLAGQNPDYMLQQMKDIKSGARSNGNTPAMRGVMHLVDEVEMVILSQYLAGLEP